MVTCWFLWLYAHVATKIAFQTWGFELTQAWIRRYRVRTEDVISLRCIPPQGGRSEKHRVRFRGGRFDVSPADFDDYLELVERFSSLLEWTNKRDVHLPADHGG